MSAQINCKSWFFIWDAHLFGGTLDGGSNVCKETSLCLSVVPTEVMCWKQHGCDICDLAGNGALGGGVRLVFLEPGTDRLIFSGQDVNRSICCHISRAALSQSKLRPTKVEWSVDRHIVWNDALLCLYDERLSILSAHKLKDDPRSANTIRMPRDVLDLASPVSNSTTGTPVYCRVHLLSPPRLVYRLTNEPHTNTCNKDFRNIIIFIQTT